MIQLRLCFWKYFDKLNRLFHNKGSWEVFFWASSKRKPDFDFQQNFSGRIFVLKAINYPGEQFSDPGNEPGEDKRFQEQLLQPVIDLFGTFSSFKDILLLDCIWYFLENDVSAPPVISMENGLGSETFEGKDKM